MAQQKKQLTNKAQQKREILNENLKTLFNLDYNINFDFFTDSQNNKIKQYYGEYETMKASEREYREEVHPEELKKREFLKDALNKLNIKKDKEKYIYIFNEVEKARQDVKDAFHWICFYRDQAKDIKKKLYFYINKYNEHINKN